MTSEVIRNTMLRQLHTANMTMMHSSTAKSFNSSRMMKENMFTSPCTKWKNDGVFEINDRLNSTVSSLKSSQAKKRSHFLTVISQFPECKNKVDMKSRKH